MPAGRASRSKRHVRLRLTLAGWAFLGASVVVAVVAINSRLALVFILFGAMMGALHVSAVLARRMISAVQVRRDVASRCWQNERIVLGYLLRSGRGGGGGMALRVQELAAGAFPAVPVYCLYLAGRRAVRSRAELVPRRRGHFRLSGLTLSTHFPFGLVTASRRFEQATSVVVWPARGKLLVPLLAGGAAESSPSAPSPMAGGQDEFYGLREYRPGDNPRWIHWRRSAGRAEPVVREMSRPRPRTVWVVLDTRLADDSPVTKARRERAIRFAATLVDEALNGGFRVGVALAYRRGAVAVAPSGRGGQRRRLLDALAGADDNTKWTLSQTLAQIRPERLREAHVVVVSAAASLRGEPSGGAGLDPQVLGRVARCCRDVSLIDGGRLAKVFADAPAGGRGEGEPCR